MGDLNLHLSNRQALHPFYPFLTSPWLKNLGSLAEVQQTWHAGAEIAKDASGYDFPMMVKVKLAYIQVSHDDILSVFHLKLERHDEL